jgi:hypothetical protein
LAQDITEFLGERFEGFKGQEAINKLMVEKRGHILGAFHRDDIGDIALIWGDETAGLAHNLKERGENGYNLIGFLSSLGEVIEKGSITKSYGGRLKILYERKLVIISPEIRGNKIFFVLTAYKTKKKT